MLNRLATLLVLSLSFSTLVSCGADCAKSKAVAAAASKAHHSSSHHAAKPSATKHATVHHRSQPLKLLAAGKEFVQEHTISNLAFQASTQVLEGCTSGGIGGNCFTINAAKSGEDFKCVSFSFFFLVISVLSHVCVWL
jgi:hypothetical protein